jgi:hypothetical protein
MNTRLTPPEAFCLAWYASGCHTPLFKTPTPSSRHGESKLFKDMSSEERLVFHAQSRALALQQAENAALQQGISKKAFWAAVEADRHRREQKVGVFIGVGTFCVYALIIASLVSAVVMFTSFK